MWQELTCKRFSSTTPQPWHIHLSYKGTGQHVRATTLVPITAFPSGYVLLSLSWTQGTPMLYPGGPTWLRAIPWALYFRKKSSS